MDLWMFCISAWMLTSGMVWVQGINEQYEGDKVYEIKTNATDNKTIIEMMKYFRKEKMDVWKEFDRIGNTCLVHVRKSQQKNFTTFCGKSKVQHTEKIKNLKSEIDKNMMGVGRRGNFDFNMYNRYNEIRKELRYLQSCNKDVMSIYCIGHSFEGRPLLLVKLSYNLRSWYSKYKPIIWIEGGMHAREWISPASAMFMLNRLLTLRGKDRNITSLLQRYRVFIVPVMNPDGYEYSFNFDRMWRKSTTKIPGSSCIGIDPNRNFDIAWGGEGSSADPCSSEYRGEKPEDEPVVKAYASLFRFFRKDLAAYFSLHSFFQLFLAPNFFTKAPAANSDQLRKFAVAFNRAVNATTGETYNIGPASILTRILTGVSTDYVNVKLGVTHSYLIELRDRGTFGFLLPPDQIAPTAIEVLNGILAGIFTVNPTSSASNHLNKGQNKKGVNKSRETANRIVNSVRSPKKKYFRRNRKRLSWQRKNRGKIIPRRNKF